MNVLDAVAISLPCRSCGDNYRVPLKDVLLSHRMLHQGCPVSQETECPPVFQSRLFERGDIEELQRAWSRLERRARSAPSPRFVCVHHSCGTNRLLA